MASETQSPPPWWQKPRRIRVVVDNNSWILTYAERLVGLCNGDGDDATLCRSHDDIAAGDISFYLGCIKISPPEVLALCRRNLVVHEGALPRDRGFSPLTWQIIDGQNEIPICLLEAAESYGIAIDDLRRERPILLHGPVAAEESRRELGLGDDEVYDAIYWHTTGRAEWNPVGLALYFADFSEALRLRPEAAAAQDHDRVRLSRSAISDPRRRVLCARAP